MFQPDEQEVETSAEPQEEVEVEAALEEVPEVEEKDEEEEIDWKERALKAEKAIEKAKKKAKEAPVKVTGDLTTSDIIALTKANIDDEDVDEVLKYAKYENISVKEALNTSVLKAILADRKELRTSAQAVNTGTTKRASSQISDERLLADARKGIMPENPDDIARLTLLRLKRK